MRENRNESRGLGTGFFFGMLIVGLVALVRGPRINVRQSASQSRERLAEVGQEIREKIEAVVPGDPIVDGIAEGKAAARRRLAELGRLDLSPPKQ